MQKSLVPSPLLLGQVGRWLIEQIQSLGIAESWLRSKDQDIRYDTHILEEYLDLSKLFDLRDFFFFVIHSCKKCNSAIRCKDFYSVIKTEVSVCQTVLCTYMTRLYIQGGFQTMSLA